MQLFQISHHFKEFSKTWQKKSVNNNPNAIIVENYDFFDLN